jgi:hypothetical protein
MKLSEMLSGTVEYIKHDFTSNRFRFLLEVFAWACSVVTSIIFACTVPDIPVVPLYTIFIAGCLATLWCAWSRGSFGLVLNYSFIVFIDLIGLGRILLK